VSFRCSWLELGFAEPRPLGTCHFINDATMEELKDALREHKQLIKSKFPTQIDGIGKDAFVDQSDLGMDPELRKFCFASSESYLSVRQSKSRRASTTKMRAQKEPMVSWSLRPPRTLVSLMVPKQRTKSPTVAATRAQNAFRRVSLQTLVHSSSTFKALQSQLSQNPPSFTLFPRDQFRLLSKTASCSRPPTSPH
jgi:hypothetical protein